MQISDISRQIHSASFFKAQDHILTKQGSNVVGGQRTEVAEKTESLKTSSAYDLADMTSEDMLGLAKSFYEEGNSQDFLCLAVYSARAALEEHPDLNVSRTWTTPRNENGSFDLLAEIQATPKYSSGSPYLDAENEADREHLLNTLLSLPIQTITIGQSSINIKV